MKYMLLIHADPEAVGCRSEQETVRVYAQIDALTGELSASGELIGGEALADVSLSKVVRAPGGVPVVSDGPFAAAREHLAGYLIVETDSLERALEIAGRWPDAREGGALEVRPIMATGGTEM